MCVGMPRPACRDAIACSMSEDSLVELVLSVHLVGPRDQTQIVNVRDRLLCQGVQLSCVLAGVTSRMGMPWVAADLLGSVTCGHHLAPLPGDYFV